MEYFQIRGDCDRQFGHYEDTTSVIPGQNGDTTNSNMRPYILGMWGQSEGTDPR